jgi:hypothetical protein
MQINKAKLSAKIEGMVQHVEHWATGTMISSLIFVLVSNLFVEHNAPFLDLLPLHHVPFIDFYFLVH